MGSSAVPSLVSDWTGPDLLFRAKHLFHAFSISCGLRASFATGITGASIGSGRDRMATRSKQLTAASPVPPLKTAAKTEKAAWAPRLQRESQAIGERLSFQHW